MQEDCSPPVRRRWPTMMSSSWRGAANYRMTSLMTRAMWRHQLAASRAASVTRAFRCACSGRRIWSATGRAGRGGWSRRPCRVGTTWLWRTAPRWWGWNGRSLCGCAAAGATPTKPSARSWSMPETGCSRCLGAPRSCWWWMCLPDLPADRDEVTGRLGHGDRHCITPGTTLVGRDELTGRAGTTWTRWPPLHHTGNHIGGQGWADGQGRDVLDTVTATASHREPHWWAGMSWRAGQGRLGHGDRRVFCGPVGATLVGRDEPTRRLGHGDRHCTA